MKANEFFKAMGIKSVKQFLENDNIRTKEMHDNLKRLIKSHELVESKGGLIKAKEILADNPVWCSGSKRYSSPLERAIADVESCMEVSSESN